jgi:GR25 family glycosyltransferase involved in LPS biosynthesis
MNNLNNFGPVYLINLKDHKHRRSSAISQFKKYGVVDYEIIEAVDGRNSDLSHIINGEYPKLKSSEIGCITSHIKALDHWLNTSDSEYAIIMEDDFSFDTVDYWPFDWEYIKNNIPSSADIVQLIIIKNEPISFNLHKKEKYSKNNKMTYEWSTACYLIKRSYAKKIVSLHYSDGKYILPNHGYANQAADVILYSLGNAYVMPLFTHILDPKNSINSDHNDFHTVSKNNIDYWWKNVAKKYKPEDLINLNNKVSSTKIIKSGCFTIFHVEEDSKIMKKRNELTKSATKILEESFEKLETPTIIIKDLEQVKDFYKGSKIKIQPLGHFGTGWKPGELGIWASNYTAWENFANSDYEYIILMEDDIVLNKDFNSKITKYIKELPEDWDVFTAYTPPTGNIRYKKNKDSLLINKENICKVYQSWSCLCYVVSKKGAKKLLKEVKSSVKSPLDNYLFYHANLNVYAIKMDKGNICNIYQTKSTVQDGLRYDVTGYVN